MSQVLPGRLASIRMDGELPGRDFRFHGPPEAHLERSRRLGDLVGVRHG